MVLQNNKHKQTLQQRQNKNKMKLKVAAKRTGGWYWFAQTIRDQIQYFFFTAPNRLLLTLIESFVLNEKEGMHRTLIIHTKQ